MKLPHAFSLERFLPLGITLWLKNVRHNLPYIRRMTIGGAHARNVFFFVIAPEIKHPGLADRLKAIIDCYNIAKMNGYQFKIIFKIPFRLEDYLVPNSVEWVAEPDELKYSMGGTRFFNELNFLTEDSWKGRTRLAPGKEYHCYSYVGNRQPRIFPESGYDWSLLYHELFRPAPRLQQAIEACGYPERSYVAVHLRFVNALENFEEVTCYDNALRTEEEKNALICRCKQGLMRIKRENGDCRILVFSDSKRFLDSLGDIPVEVLCHDNVGHISFGSDGDTTLKTFIDLYMIARAKKVYRIDAPELYGWSCFAVTGALMGGVDCLTVKV